MSFETDHPNIDFFVKEFVDGTAGIKKALADGKFDPAEVIDVVRAVNPAVADFLDQQFKGLKGLYPEVKALTSEGPFRMLMDAGPYFAKVLFGIFQ